MVESEPHHIIVNQSLAKPESQLQEIFEKNTRLGQLSVEVSDRVTECCVTCEDANLAISFAKFPKLQDVEVENEQFVVEHGSTCLTMEEVQEIANVTLDSVKSQENTYRQEGTLYDDIFESFDVPFYDFTLKRQNNLVSSEETVPQHQDKLVSTETSRPLNFQFSPISSEKQHKIWVVLEPSARIWKNNKGIFIHLIANVKYGWSFQRTESGMSDKYIEPVSVQVTASPMNPSNKTLESTSIKSTPSQYSSSEVAYHQATTDAKGKIRETNIQAQLGAGANQLSLATPSHRIGKEVRSENRNERTSAAHVSEFEETIQVVPTEQDRQVVVWRLGRRFSRYLDSAQQKWDLRPYSQVADLSEEEMKSYIPGETDTHVDNMVNFGVWKWEDSCTDFSFKFTTEHTVRVFTRYTGRGKDFHRYCRYSSAIYTSPSLENKFSIILNQRDLRI